MQGIITDETTAIYQQIAEKIGQHKYKIWFKNLTKMSIADNYLRIGVPNPFIGNWIEDHFAKDIANAAKTVTGNDLILNFNIDTELLNNQSRNQLDSQADSVNRSNNRTTRTRQKINYHNTRPLKLRLDDFVVGKSNELAYNAAKAVCKDAVTPFNPLFLHGSYGLGKTHLLQGICNEIVKTRPNVKWLYVSAEDFTNQYVLALKTRKIDDFRRRFRQTDLLAIDDVHFLASKTSTQEEFLHTFNTIDLAGKQILLASDAHPKMIGQLCDKLISRFVSGMVVKMELPDYETRLNICRKKAHSMKRDIPENVLEYVAHNLKTNIREIEGALLKIVAFASLTSEKINLATATNVLADHISRTDPIVHASDIEAAAATFFAITIADLHSSKKDRTVSLARAFSMYLARNYTNMSFPEIGKVMGKKNHATVILACRKIEDALNANSTMKWISPSGPRNEKAPEILEKLKSQISL